MTREIANRLDLLLKPLDFKRKNLVWNRWRGDFLDVITIQKARYSTSTNQSITGNVAVCVPEFRRIMFVDTPEFQNEADGVFSVRFAEIAENNFSGRTLDRWWSLTDESKDRVSSELFDIVKNKVLPFLNSFSDFSVLEQHLCRISGSQTKLPYFQINKALVYWKLGNPIKCEELLSSIKNWPEKIEVVREWISQRSR